MRPHAMATLPNHPMGSTKTTGRYHTQNKRCVNDRNHDKRKRMGCKGGQLIHQMATEVPNAVSAGTLAAVAATALVLADPQNRRRRQMEDVGGNELDAVKNYFNNAGYERWKKIYGETEDVNRVQLDIRKGHAQTVDKVLRWLGDQKDLQGVRIVDAGCGTGLLSVPLAMRGAEVYASDISAAMVEEAKNRYLQAKKETDQKPVHSDPNFEVADLESIQGKYDVVVCLDVMIHYPQGKVDEMIQHLASLADKKLLVSFAPKTWQYVLLKRIGELFPGPSKATRAYLHAEADVEAALQRAGFKVTKREMTATQFYFSRLLECERS